MIYSQLRCRITNWDLASKTTLVLLIKLQKRIVRIMHECDYRDRTEPIFQEMKLPKACDIFIFNPYQNIVFVYLNRNIC